MKILVCGGRDFDNDDLVFDTLDKLHKDRYIDIIIEGGARGADHLANCWAKDRGIHIAQVEALWKHYGRSAGHIRNGLMLHLCPDMVVSFPGGKGTANMVKQAKELLVEVMEINESTTR